MSDTVTEVKVDADTAIAEITPEVAASKETEITEPVDTPAAFEPLTLSSIPEIIANKAEEQLSEEDADLAVRITNSVMDAIKEKSVTDPKFFDENDYSERRHPLEFTKNKWGFKVGDKLKTAIIARRICEGINGDTYRSRVQLHFRIKNESVKERVKNYLSFHLVVLPDYEKIDEKKLNEHNSFLVKEYDRANNELTIQVIELKRKCDEQNTANLYFKRKCSGLETSNEMLAKRLAELMSEGKR